MRRKIITLLLALLLCCSAVYAENDTTGTTEPPPESAPTGGSDDVPSAQALTLLVAELQDENGDAVVDGTAVYDPTKEYLVELHVDGTTESPAAEVYTVTYKKGETVITGFPKNVGDYDITVEIKETYRAEYAIGSASGYSVSMSLEITPCPVEIIDSGTEPYYTGNAQRPDHQIVLVNGVTDVTSLITVTYNGSSDQPVNAGTYEVIYQLTDGNNYAFAASSAGTSTSVSKGYSFTIAKRPLRVIASPGDWSDVYDGTRKDMVFELKHSISDDTVSLGTSETAVTYYRTDDEGNSVEADPIDAGTYSWVFELVGSGASNNRIDSIESDATDTSCRGEFNIDKCPVKLTVQMPEGDIIYDGQNHAPAISWEEDKIITVTDGDDQPITPIEGICYEGTGWEVVEKGPVDAGLYRMEYWFTAEYADNYCFWVDENTTSDYITPDFINIDQCPITLTMDADPVYTGEAQAPTYTLTYGAEGAQLSKPLVATYVYTDPETKETDFLDGLPTNAGDYSVNYSLAPGEDSESGDEDNFYFVENGEAVGRDIARTFSITPCSVELTYGETSYFYYDGEDHLQDVFTGATANGKPVHFMHTIDAAEIATAPLYLIPMVEGSSNTEWNSDITTLPNSQWLTLELGGTEAANYALPANSEIHRNVIIHQRLVYASCLNGEGWALPYNGYDRLPDFFQVTRGNENLGAENLNWRIIGDDVEIKYSLVAEDGYTLTPISELIEPGLYTVRLSIVGDRADCYRIEAPDQFDVEIYEVRDITVKVIEVPGAFTYTGYYVDPVPYLDFIMPADVDDIPVELSYLHTGGPTYDGENAATEYDSWSPFEVGQYSYKVELLSAYTGRYRLLILTEEGATPLTADDFTGEFRITPASISGSNFVDNRFDYIHGAGPYVAQLPELMYMGDIMARDRDELIAEELEQGQQSALLYIACTYSSLDGGTLDGTPIEAGEYVVEYELAGELAYRYTLPEGLTRRLSLRPDYSSPVQLAIDRAFSLTEAFWSVEGEPGGVTYYPGVTFYVNPIVTDLVPDLLLTFIQANGG